MKKDKKNYNKTVAVLFSSGLDSTYLIWKNLKEGNKVRPFYIEIKNNINKSKIEKQNIFILYEKFKAEFGTQIEHPELILALDVFRAWNGLKFQQVPIWLFALNYVRDSDVDEIQIGYVSNDDAISYTDEITKTYENQRWFFNNEKIKTKLTFPLVKEKKEQMLKDMRDTEYIKHVFSCENPTIVEERGEKTEDIYGWKKDFLGEYFVKYENCGNCVPCNKILRDPDLRHQYIDYVNADFKRLYLKNLEADYNYNFPKTVDQLEPDDSVRKIEVKVLKKSSTDSIEVDMSFKPTNDLKAIGKMIEDGSLEKKLGDIEDKEELKILLADVNDGTKKKLKTLLTDVDGETIGFSKGGTVTDETLAIAKSFALNAKEYHKPVDSEYEVKEKADNQVLYKKDWNVKSTSEINTEEVNDRPDFEVKVIENT